MREICDRYGVLLVSDEVICAFGRLGTWFGAERLGYQPDMITMAKGLTSGYSPLGGVMVSRPHRRAVPRAATRSFLHGITFGGHPVSCAVALANLDIIEHEDLLGHVRGQRGRVPQRARRRSRDLPIVGDVRGMGYFYGIELVKDTATKETFTDEEADRLLRGVLTPTLFERRPAVPGRRPRRPGDPAVARRSSPAPSEFDEIGRDHPHRPHRGHGGHGRDR